MKKIAFAGVLLAASLLAACDDERPAPPPASNYVDDGNGVITEPAPYPGDRK